MTDAPNKVRVGDTIYVLAKDKSVKKVDPKLALKNKELAELKQLLAKKELSKKEKLRLEALKKKYPKEFLALSPKKAPKKEDEEEGEEKPKKTKPIEAPKKVPVKKTTPAKKVISPKEFQELGLLLQKKDPSEKDKARLEWLKNNRLPGKLKYPKAPKKTTTTPKDEEAQQPAWVDDISKLPDLTKHVKPIKEEKPPKKEPEPKPLEEEEEKEEKSKEPKRHPADPLVESLLSQKEEKGDDEEEDDEDKGKDKDDEDDDEDPLDVAAEKFKDWSDEMEPEDEEKMTPEEVKDREDLQKKLVKTKEVGLSPAEKSLREHLQRKEKNDDLSPTEETKLKKLNDKAVTVHEHYDDMDEDDQKAIAKNWIKEYAKRIEERRKAKKSPEKKEDDVSPHLHSLAKKLNLGEDVDKDTIDKTVRSDPKKAQKIFKQHGIDLNVPENPHHQVAWKHHVNEKHVKRDKNLSNLIDKYHSVYPKAKGGDYESQKELEKLKTVFNDPSNFSAKARKKLDEEGIKTSWNENPSGTDKFDAKQKTLQEGGEKKEETVPTVEPKKEETTQPPKPTGTKPPPIPKNPKEEGEYKNTEDYRRNVGKCPPGWRWHEEDKKCKPNPDTPDNERWKPSKETHLTSDSATERGRNISRAVSNIKDLSHVSQRKVLDSTADNVSHIANAGHIEKDPEKKKGLLKILKRIGDAIKPHLGFLFKNHKDKASNVVNSLDKARHVFVEGKAPAAWKPKPPADITQEAANEIIDQIIGKP